jgi:hypothetical protein
VEITISGIGTSQMSASASVPVDARVPSFSLSAPGLAGGGGDGTIQLQPLSTGSFTSGSRSAGGVRYMYASFRVRNAQSNGTAYDTQRRNLTFLAVATGSTVNGTAVSAMRRFDGSSADASLALALLPTGAVTQERDGAVTSRFPDVLQLYQESEIIDVSAPAGANVLPYGFVVSNPATAGSRTLPASPGPDQFDGVVTFAFRVPLQSTAAADPFTVSVMMLAMEDDETRITQSLEEQGAGQPAFEQRAAALSATSVTLLGGGDYDGLLPARMLCSVRTAGPVNAPTATLSAPGPCMATGESVRWTGAVSTDWSVGGNWDLGRVPTANDIAVLAATTLQPVITGEDKTIRGLVTTDTLETSLDLDGYTLTVSGDIQTPAASVSNGTVRMTGAAAALAGQLNVLRVEGGVRLTGSTHASGPVTVSGSLSTNDQPLTISLP